MIAGTVGADCPELQEARKELSACMFSNSWMLTVSAMVPAVAYGVYKKTYTPLVMVSVVGTTADYYRAANACDPLKQKVKTLEAEYIASKFKGDPTAASDSSSS